MGWQAGEALRIAVLQGGDSHEREVSLKSGRCVCEALETTGHACEAIDPREVPLEAVDWSAFDAAFIALHGGAGEDGRVQRQLEELKVPYTGSGPLASQMAMCKSISKDRFLSLGVPTLPFALLDAWAGLDTILPKLEPLGYPLVFKPDCQGSSLGLSVVRSADEVEDGLRRARRYDPFVLAEPFVRAREVTVAVLGRKALPVLEISTSHDCFDYDAKYQDPGTHYSFDLNLSDALITHIQQVAVAAASGLRTSGLVRVDLLLDVQPWVLEVNTVPGLTERSLAPRAAAEAGLGFAGLCEWMVEDCLGVHASP